MLRLIAFALLSVVPAVAHTQTPLAAHPEATVGRWELKGTPLGQSLKDYRSLHPEHVRNGIKCVDPGWGDGGDWQCIRLRETLAGQQCNLSAVFIDEIASAVHAMNIDANRFADVLAALREKFGEPGSVETGVVKNLMGVEFQNTTVTWTAPNGDVLTARERSGNVDESTVTLESRDFAATMQRLLDAEAKRAAGDL